MRMLLGLALGGLVASCGGPGPAQPPAERPLGGGPYVTVTIVDAVVGLARIDGTAWDGDATVPESVRADLRVALVKPSPYAAVIDVLAANDGAPWGKPDPKGTVTLLGQACDSPLRVLPTRTDTHRPSWSPGVSWSHVTLDPGVRFQVVLADDDGASGDELVGIVDLTHAHLSQALALRGAVHHADVSAQRQPILFVGITVTAE
jgi:hypothetical protein